jgi:beta-glucosidase/6-phospho-beta-glucosidase/beta-galactosidase
MNEFIFATGIECSTPTIDQGRWRLDELEAIGHYKRWKEDLHLVRQIGIKYLRYGFPIYKTFLGRGKYDWEFADLVMQEMQRLGIVPIIDFCHFGLPGWLGNFQNPEIVIALPEYAEAFAKRYPWVTFYTPVNEMYVTARKSALEGSWNEQLRSEKGFVTAASNLALASKHIMMRLAELNPNIIFINSESSEFYQPCCPEEKVQTIAALENERRFLASDLLYAHSFSDTTRTYAFDNGLDPQAYEWCMNTKPPPKVILGIDYYTWNEKVVARDGSIQEVGELFGWYVITAQYYDRYRMPMMHTETNTFDSTQAPQWLWRQWHNVELMRTGGVPVVGFTWFSLHDQIDWDIGLSKAIGNVNAAGLFDLNRDPRPVALAYKYLIEMFSKSNTLKVHVDF